MLRLQTLGKPGKRTGNVFWEFFVFFARVVGWLPLAARVPGVDVQTIKMVPTIAHTHLYNEMVTISIEYT